MSTATALKTYSETFLLRTTHCDLSGAWRPSDILATLQELAGMHAHLLGCGRERLIQDNLVWVLSRTELVMDRYPCAGETVRVETFPMANKRWFFPRYYVLYDAAGQVIGKAGTLWLLMDFVARKMAMPQAALASLPDNSDLQAPLDMPGNIPLLESPAVFSLRQPQYTEIDINGHVNNTRYADWLCNGLGIEAMKDQEIAHLLIHYTREVLPGAEVRLALQQDGPAFRLAGQVGEEKHFDIGGTLRPRVEKTAQGL